MNVKELRDELDKYLENGGDPALEVVYECEIGYALVQRCRPYPTINEYLTTAPQGSKEAEIEIQDSICFMINAPLPPEESKIEYRKNLIKKFGLPEDVSDEIFHEKFKEWAEGLRGK